jgi:hypothetical protein
MAYIAMLDQVPGWFFYPDARVFAGIDAYQRASGVTGDLLEIGVYLGKSAILMGYLRRDGERLVVCDLFESEGTTEESRRENCRWYGGLSRQEFEDNYRRFHDRLPTVLACPSSELSRVGPPGSFRIVHVDGSHVYDIVQEDLGNAERLLGDGGVVIVDDWRSAHTPGVAAATWEAILNRRLVPFCFTDQKMYATWSRSMCPSPLDVRSWMAEVPPLEVQTYQVLGREVHRVTLPAAGTRDVPEQASLRGVLRMLPSAALRAIRRRLGPN